ncbi:MAG: hypothetical protein ACE149_15885 [Armatimonadota bacterium]
MAEDERPLRNSNPIRLSWPEWAVALAVVTALLWLLPAALPMAGERLSRADYRLPSELSGDYWMFEKWSQYSRTAYRAAVLGDSVVWGQYARSDDTLSHHLNALAGGRVFANLGVDGLHPAAMAGMVRYCGEALRGEPVLLHLNPLWMASPEQDLSGRREARFNHPKLVPQLVGRPSAYRPSAPEALGAALERTVPFWAWKEHVKIALYQGMAPQEWSLDNPYRLLPERGPDAFSGDEPGSPPETWEERGIAPQDLPWVEAAKSYQWRSFTRTVELLRSRGSRVFVLVGPFNTHALTPASQARYGALAAKMAQWLEQQSIPYYAPPALPTELYADASHPLGPGYRRLAEELLASPAFQKWRIGWSRK